MCIDGHFLVKIEVKFPIEMEKGSRKMKILESFHSELRRDSIRFQILKIRHLQIEWVRFEDSKNKFFQILKNGT